MHRTGRLEDHRRSPGDVVVDFGPDGSDAAVYVPGDGATEGAYSWADNTGVYDDATFVLPIVAMNFLN